MGETTDISWANSTFNPWIGCTRVSDGCRFCYAESLSTRYGWVKWGPGETRKRTSAANWRKPLAWNRAALKAGVRHRVFCASLADVFDHEAPTGARDDLWNLIRQCRELDWQLLTKRPENIAQYLPDDWGVGWPHVWLGVSVESDKYVSRIQTLRATPAAVRFVSVEPLLGPVDLDLTRLSPRLTGVPGIDWVIAGGESGPGARPMHPDWARSIRDQCIAAGVSFHFKQFGEWVPFIGGFGNEHIFEDGQAVLRVGKKDAGRILDGQTWDQFPEERSTS